MLVKEAAQSRGMNFNPSVVFIDFEIALVQSVNLLFPSSQLKGCYYHFVQALWRWVQNHGCVILYKDNSEFRSLIKCTAALAHVPRQYLHLVWSGIKAAAPEMPVCSDFIDYFKDTWLKGSFPVVMWNHSDNEGPATNNHLEDWRARLNRLAKKSHTNIYEVIEIFQREEASSKVTILQLQSGGVARKGKAKAQKNAKRLKKLKKKLRKNKIALYDFVVGASYLNHI